METAESTPQEGDKNRPKLVVELKELDEIYQRFKLVFILSNVLTMLLAAYVIMQLLSPPERLSDPWMKKLQTIGLCTIMGGSILLCGVQWLCLRQTTMTSRRKIEQMTFVDALTNVYNYRYLDRRLDEEIRIAKRFGTTLSVVYMDMDGFKRVNDECGHKAGNVVLSELGAILRVGARTTDLVGRMGGDEFLLILPNTNRDEAQIVSERLRKRIEARVFDFDGRKVDYVRASMGVATFPYDTQDKESLITAADRAMYRAKQTGGNRVCI